ncbi:hypothetical protein OsJ_29358 [Oryza sativa Japonica Group]|uniref:Uncharacterized protein n=1 Tax=Oryza sativa subsp. japonica TaxID=39947 RepID=B9G3K5_ORYSJ|nr:hypothetical protein OsJ_29358 [Oryza sativa Japonica Group]
MTSSGKRADGFLRRFRRRRLLAFLRREHLYATLDALGGETRLFLNARTLQTMLADCRWEEARRCPSPKKQGLSLKTPYYYCISTLVDGHMFRLHYWRHYW